MQSVSSNAVAESFSYVVGEEIKTGRRFFDGTNWRDVYTKAIKIETSTLTGDYSLPAIPNLDNLISVKGNVRMTNFLFPIPFNDVDSTPNWCAYININPNTKVPYLWIGTSQGNSNPFTVFIIFEYSKTTD